MYDYPHTAIRRRQLDSRRNSEIDPNSVTPFGPGGAGLVTEHPVGLVFAVGIVIVALTALPEARIFFLASVAAGGIIGLILRLIHR